MALKDSRLFRVTAYTLFGLSIASFVFAIVTRVMGGHGTEIYRGGRGLPIPNVAALVTIIGIALVLLFGLGLHAWRRLRDAMTRKREARKTGDDISTPQDSS